MKLFGSFLSPYVRRTAVSMNIMGLPFDSEQVPVFQNPEPVAKHNPLVRVPTLVLDDDESLVESYAILDALDEMAGAEKRLVPASGKERRHVLKITAVGSGTMDKAVWAVYEPRFHPPEKVHQPWIDHNVKQVHGGLAFLDDLAKTAGDSSWLAGTPKISQADVTAAVALSFVEKALPKIGAAAKVPHLAKFTARLEAMDAFKKVPLPA